MKPHLEVTDSIRKLCLPPSPPSPSSFLLYLVNGVNHIWNVLDPYDF